MYVNRVNPANAVENEKIIITFVVKWYYMLC
jgi:hypothetical protein